MVYSITTNYCTDVQDKNGFFKLVKEIKLVKDDEVISYLENKNSEIESVGLISNVSIDSDNKEITIDTYPAKAVYH